ncbi:hypothetical protein [Faecalimonas sp.]
MFFSLKQTCSCCGNECGWNRWRIKKGKGWICPECFKKIGGIKKADYLSTKTIEELKNIIQNNSSPVSVSTDIAESSLESELLAAREISSRRKVYATLSFRVSGVTFKTGRKSRQVMLKNMYFNNTPPFDDEITITFKRYDFEGSLAIGVYANDLQIGNVPRDLVETFDKYWISDYTASFDVYGGGNKNWGCEVDVVFYK